MDIKNIIRRTMAFVAIVAISAAAAMAQTVALKQDTNGKWGIAYTDGRGNWGKWAVKAEYTVIEPFEEGYYLAQKDGKWGILRQNGKKVLDCKYTRDMFSAFGYIFAQEVGKPDKWAVLDRLANSQEWEKTYFKNVSITNVSDSIRVIKGELGVSYLPNNVREDYMRKIDPMWKAMHQPTIEVEYGKSILAMRDGGTVSFAVTKSGIAINDVKNMKHIAGSIYACFSGNMKYYCCDFSNGTRLGIVKSNAQLPTDNTLYVVTNSNGNPIYYISNMGQVCWFERNIEVDGLSCRLISDSNGKYGLVSNDKSGKILLKVEYDKIMDRNREYGGTLYEKYIYICKDGLWGICRNADGQNLKIILDCKYPGYANADSDNNPPFAYARGYERFVVTAEGMAGVIDENGKEVLSCTYDSASYDFYGNGYSGAKSAIFEKDGKSIVYNLIDGTMVTRKYSNYKGLLNGYTRVEQNGKFGVVDSKDNLIVPIKYSQITEAITSDNGHLDDGFHVWDADGRVGVVKVINGKGKEIVPCAGNYDRIWGYESYGVIVVKNGKQGCIKENGATFCRPVYDGHINGLKRIGFVKNSATSNDVTVDIYDYNGKYLTSVNVGNNYLDQRWFVEKYLM